MSEHTGSEHPGDHGHEGYQGAATLVVDGRELAVTVTMRGQFEPVDGRYHWYGRVKADAALSELLGGRDTPAVVRTPDGAAAGALSAPDQWDRYRISGTGRPPFPVATALTDVEG